MTKVSANLPPLDPRVKAAVEAFRERTEFNAYASDMAAALAAADSVDPHRERYREALEAIWAHMAEWLHDKHEHGELRTLHDRQFAEQVNYAITAALDPKPETPKEEHDGA